MSSFGEIRRLNSAFANECPDFVASWASGYLVALNFFPITLSGFMLGISMYYADIFLALLSWWLTVDWLLNWLLSLAFRQPPLDATSTFWPSNNS